MIWRHVTRNVQTVTEGDTLRDVIHLMASGSFRHVPVLDSLGNLTGMMSDRDVRRLLPSPDRPAEEVDEFIQSTQVGSVMTRMPITIQHDANMLEAVHLMLKHRFGALPVMRNGRMVGIITQTNVLEAYQEILEEQASDDELIITETPPAYEAALGSPESGESHVFLVEPSVGLRRDLAMILCAGRFKVTEFADFNSLVEAPNSQHPDIILVNADAQSQEDLDPLSILSEGYPRTPVVVTKMGHPPHTPGNEGHRAKGPLYLPCSPEHLLKRIRGEIGYARWTHDLPVIQEATLVKRAESIDIDISVSRQALVVDHDAFARQILSYHLRKLGFEVIEAANGHDALRHLDQEFFDLVTLELNLPFRNGFEVLDYLQRQPERSPCPIVVSSAHRDEDVVQAFALGAHDFIEKPFKGSILESRVKRISQE